MPVETRRQFKARQEMERIRDDLVKDDTTVYRWGRLSDDSHAVAVFTIPKGAHCNFNNPRQFGRYESYRCDRAIMKDCLRVTDMYKLSFQSRKNYGVRFENKDLRLSPDKYWYVGNEITSEYSNPECLDGPGLRVFKTPTDALNAVYKNRDTYFPKR